MNWHLAKRLGVVLAMTLLAACSDEGDEGGDSNPDDTSSGGDEHRPGLGKSTKAPEGRPFTLPAGLTLETPIMGYAPEDPEDCDDIYGDEAYGHGARVRLCLIFNNPTGSPINVTLPPGLIFISKNLKVQNGILTQGISFEVPAGTRFFAPILMYCANSPRRPTDPLDEYAVGPITEYEDFQELFRLLEGRSISREEGGYIQVAVQHLTEGKGLSASDRATIDKM